MVASALPHAAGSGQPRRLRPLGRGRSTQCRLLWANGFRHRVLAATASALALSHRLGEPGSRRGNSRHLDRLLGDERGTLHPLHSARARSDQCLPARTKTLDPPLGSSLHRTRMADPLHRHRRRGHGRPHAALSARRSPNQESPTYSRIRADLQFPDDPVSHTKLYRRWQPDNESTGSRLFPARHTGTDCFFLWGMGRTIQDRWRY